MEYSLLALTGVMSLVAMLSLNRAALSYAGIIVLHDVLFSGYRGSELVWLFSGGLFAAISVAACIHLRKGVEDDIAYWLAILSVVWVLVSMGHILAWVAYVDTAALNYIFLILNMASIYIIVFGGDSGMVEDERDSDRINNKHSMASSIYHTCRRGISYMAQSKGAK